MSVVEAFAPLLVVSIGAWLAQWLGSLWVEGRVWNKLTTLRAHKPVPYRDLKHRTWKGRWKLHRKVLGDEAAQLGVVHWSEDHSHWTTRAATIRRSFLQRTHETAERWRNIFAGLLGVFGIVFFVNKPDLDATSDPQVVRWAILTVIALAIHAVAYTGWAAAGLPKMLVDVDAATAFEAEMRQGARALVRLRIGICAGCLTAAGLTLVVAEVLR